MASTVGSDSARQEKSLIVSKTATPRWPFSVGDGQRRRRRRSEHRVDLRANCRNPGSRLVTMDSVLAADYLSSSVSCDWTPDRQRLARRDSRPRSPSSSGETSSPVDPLATAFCINSPLHGLPIRIAVLIPPMNRRAIIIRPRRGLHRGAASTSFFRPFRAPVFWVGLLLLKW